MSGDELEPYLGHLRQLAFVKGVRIAHLSREQARLVIDTSGAPIHVTAELKRTHLTGDLAERLVHVRARASELMIFAPVVGRDIAQRFARAKLNFVDLAGNCHVEIGDRYYVHVEGRRQEVPRTTMRPLRAPAYQVLFALLADPMLIGATARALATAAGKVSPQTAIDVRKRLFENDMLLPSRAPRWSPGGWKRALDLFVSGFTTTLSPSLVIGRYRAREHGRNELEAAFSTRLAESTPWRWGGGAACQRLTGFYRGDLTILYIAGPAPSPSQLQVISDAQGPIHIASSPCPIAFVSPEPDTVHPLLAYADLLAEGNDRATEAAAEVYDRYLASMSS